MDVVTTSTAPLLVSVCEKSVIKPSFLTPSTLRYHKLSFIDQSLSNMYIPFAFFYPKKTHDDSITSKSCQLSDIALSLQRCLSKILVSYYPYAGRLRDNATVDCNDMGAEFLSVRIKCPMSEILNNPQVDSENVVFPRDLPWKNNYEGGHLLVAQVSLFDCGGIAISVCLSHKIGDGLSVLNFFNDWATLFTDPTFIPSPRFIRDSIFSSQYGSLLVPQIESHVSKCVQKRLVFPTAKLEALRDKVIGESGVEKPTRAEIVSALVFKCATKSAPMRPSKLVHYLNVRPMMKPRQPRTAIGNVLSVFSISANKEQDFELPKLVHNLRNKIEDAYKKNQVEQNELIIEVAESMKKGKLPFENDEYDMYYCSNLCKFPYYSVDFGWGKPERVCLPNGPFKNCFFLKDYQTGKGVEARVMLQKHQMSAFEYDEELLEFVSLPTKTA